MEYNNDFERRRAYISSREKMRKRRRTVYLTILFMVLAALFLLVGGGILIKKHGGLPGLAKKETETSSDPSSRNGDTNVSLAESGSDGDASSETPSSTALTAAYNTGDAALDEILNSAHAKFVTYDYDAALEILNSATDYA